jgi:hypothetical protein
MIENYNYYVSKSQIFNLENNLPMQSVNGNQLKLHGQFRKENNERKIYFIQSRYLSVEKANELCFPASRMDVLLWKNISDQGDQSGVIDCSTKTLQFNQVFNGQSLFHYFVSNSEIIEVIHDKFSQAKEDGSLLEEEKFMPLVLLNPDFNGKTALELAVEYQRPKPFELMINLLSQFDEFCFSKMMITILPKMLDQETDIIVKYLNESIFVSETMKEPMTVPWNDGK